MIRFEPLTPPYHADRLGFSLFLALAGHAMLVFGLGFSLFPDQPAATSLEVTLATHRSETAPDDADFLAQDNQSGSGELERAQIITTDRLSEIDDPNYRDSARPMPVQPRLEADIAVTRLTTTADTATKAPTDDGRDNGERQPLPQPEWRQEMASLQARLDSQHQQYSKMPRVLRLTAASTRAADQAAYLHYWVDRIERIGNLNYPNEARLHRIFGSLRLAVTLMPDGTVDSVEIIRSSGHAILDQAAIRIVRTASPFTPFPPQMRNWDRIEIIRSWHFVPGNLLQTRRD